MLGLTAPGGDPDPEGSGSALPGHRGNSEPLIQLSVQRQAPHALPLPNTAGHGRLRKSVSLEHEGLSVGSGVPSATCLPPCLPPKLCLEVSLCSQALGQTTARYLPLTLQKT